MTRQSLSVEDSFQLTDEERNQLQGVIDEIGGTAEIKFDGGRFVKYKKIDSYCVNQMLNNSN